MHGQTDIKQENVQYYKKVTWKVLKFASWKRAPQVILIWRRDVTVLVMLILLLQMEVGNSYFIVRISAEQNGTHKSAPMYSEQRKSGLHIVLA